MELFQEFCKKFPINSKTMKGNFYPPYSKDIQMIKLLTEFVIRIP